MTIVLEKDRVWKVENFLSQDKCKILIENAEKVGFQDSPVSGGGSGRTGREDPRTNQYLVIADEKIANELFKQISSLIPENLEFIDKSPTVNGTGKLWKPVGCVERLRFYKYEKGQEYPEHMDGAYARKIVKEDGSEYTQQSFLTLLIYLNEGFSEGNTVFFPDHQHCRFLRDIEDKIPTITVEPKVGQCLFYTHSILHAGTPPKEGTKYVVRTDILYEKKVEKNKKIEKFEKNEKKEAKIGEWFKIFEPSCKLYHD